MFTLWPCCNRRNFQPKVRNAVKLCVKATAYVQFFFQLFGAAFIRGQLICNVLSLQNQRKQSGMMYSVQCTVKEKFDFVNVNYCFEMHKHFGMQKAAKTAQFGSHFQAVASFWVRLMCNLSFEKKCGLHSSAALIKLQSSAAFILYTTLQYVNR